LFKRRLDLGFAFLGSQVQHLDIIAVRPSGILCLQSVIEATEGRRRVQVGAKYIACKSTWLTNQPRDDVAVVNQVPLLPTQSRHPLNQGIAVPDLDLFDSQTHLDDFPDQTGRDRVEVAPHLDRAPAPYAYAPALLGVQPPGRQRPQSAHLRLQGRLPASVALSLHIAQKGLVLGPAGEVATATEQERLVHRLLEPAMALLTITVLMPAGRIGGLGNHAVVGQQGPVGRRKLLCLTIGIHSQGHAVGAVSLRYAAQGPQSVLQALTQAGEALSEADGDVLPVRMGEHEVVDEVIEGLAGDGYAKAAHVGKVRSAQAAWFMDLGEVNLLGRSMRCLPGTDAAFKGPTNRVGKRARIGSLEPAKQRYCLQVRLPLEQSHDLRPDTCQGIAAGAPGARSSRFTG
jgi:hypothetical protein